MSLYSGLSALIASGWIAAHTPLAPGPAQLSASIRAAASEVGGNLLNFLDAVKDVGVSQLKALQQELKSNPTQTLALLKALEHTLVLGTEQAQGRVGRRLARRLRAVLQSLESTPAEQLQNVLRDSHRSVLKSAVTLGQDMLAHASERTENPQPELWRLAHLLQRARGTPTATSEPTQAPSSPLGAVDVFPTNPKDWEETSPPWHQGGSDTDQRVTTLVSGLGITLGLGVLGCWVLLFVGNLVAVGTFLGPFMGPLLVFFLPSILMLLLAGVLLVNFGVIILSPQDQ